MSRLLVVSGSRDMRDDAPIREVFDEFRPTLLFHGACRGADELADEVAYRRAIPCDEFPVDWSNGPGGGPARNQRMVEAAVETKNRGWQVLVACFPGPQSRGTWDLMRRSKTEGLTVVVVRVPRKGDQ